MLKREVATGRRMNIAEMCIVYWEIQPSFPDQADNYSLEAVKPVFGFRIRDLAIGDSRRTGSRCFRLRSLSHASTRPSNLPFDHWAAS